MKIADKNLRATALKEFWSAEYPESIYLWHGAKHDRSLREIENCSTRTLDDLFATQQAIQEGHDFCKAFYYRVLPVLSRKLNEIHELDLPDSFWQTALGYWLYRHIAIVYEKFAYLRLLDIDATSTRLLSRDSYFIPQNHVDYIFCFAGDFGVQQLVSQYYDLYGRRELEEIKLKFEFEAPSVVNLSRLDSLKRRLSLMKNEPRIALLGTFFSRRNHEILTESSGGDIGNLLLPPVSVQSTAVDHRRRGKIAEVQSNDDFSDYFFNSLHFCIPRDLVENFPAYYRSFARDIDARRFTHIASENWISNIPNSIYIAMARERERAFIAVEHAAGAFYYQNYMQFIDYDVATTYLSVGWRSERKNFVAGGFACRDITPYRSEPRKKTILFVGHTRFVYWQAFNETHAANSFFIRKMKLIAKFIELLPSELKANFKFRPRPGKHYWDVARLLELEKLGVTCDQGEFTDSIGQSRVVVIDHISTGLAEIMLMKVPFMLLHDVDFIPLDEELRAVFDELIKCKVVHTTSESAVEHLVSIYEDVDAWWQSDEVSAPLQRLVEMSLAPGSQTLEFLLSIPKDPKKYASKITDRIGSWFASAIWLCFKLVKKAKIRKF